ncbi:MAG: DUF4240 domain-containing protein [Planctomycetota bacterium]
MTDEQFWAIIARSYKNAGSDFERQLGELQALLEALNPEEILEFGGHFERRMALAYHWDVWAAAFIIRGGCSDDSFVDFRGTLIAFGQQVFESVMEDSDRLRDVLDRVCFDDPEDEMFVEGFPSVADRAYFSLTGQETPVASLSQKLRGAPWDDRTDDLAKRCPRLWNRYGPQDDSQDRYLAQAREWFGKRKYKNALDAYAKITGELAPMDERKRLYCEKRI